MSRLGLNIAAKPIPAQQAMAARAGGGGLGQKLGMAAGAIIGGMAGGPAGAMTGAATGAGLGSAMGEMASPGRAGQQAMARRAEMVEPQIRHSEQSATLRDSILALEQAPPEIKAQYSKPLAEAYMQSLVADNARPPGGQA